MFTIRTGRIPPNLLESLRAEGLQLHEERLRGAVEQFDIRGPGRFDFTSWDRESI